MRIVLFALSILLLSIAGTAKDAADKLSSRLIGEWRNVSIVVTGNAADPDSSTHTILVEADEASWDTVLKIKPIRTTFAKDGTWKSEYRNLEDVVVRKVSGKWRVRGDSLVFVQLKPEQSSATYHISVDGNLATFTAFMDWDLDGTKDDLYVGVQRKHN